MKAREKSKIRFAVGEKRNARTHATEISLGRRRHSGPGFLPLRACLGFSSFELAFVRRNNDTANIMYCPAFAGALRNETGRRETRSGEEEGKVGGQTVKNRGERNNGVAFAKNNRYIYIYPVSSIEGKQAKNAAKIGTVTVRASSPPLC